jgi:nucleoid-associated protein YgaU
MRRRIACCGTVVLAVTVSACQQYSVGGHQRTLIPDRSIENQSPIPATPSDKPSVEVRGPAMLAAEEVTPQPKDQYAPSAQSPRVHTVELGDTLFGLARQYYGNQQQWRRIYQANINRIEDPHRIKVGMKLIIP